MQLITKGIKVPYQESQQNCYAIQGLIIVNAEFQHPVCSICHDSYDTFTLTLMNPDTKQISYARVSEHCFSSDVTIAIE